MRAADTVWAAEGVAAVVGKRVRVVGVKGTVLTVGGDLRMLFRKR